MENATDKYLDVPRSAIIFKDRFDQLTYALERRPPGLCLEFGVFKGSTTRHIQAKLGGDESLYAFDTFTGLPEDWDMGKKKHPAGHFTLKGRLPNLIPPTIPVKGLIQDTLPKWLEWKSPLLKIGFMHIDVDLYSATKCILGLTKPHLAEGAIIVFDELADFQAQQVYTNWREGEYKALIEEFDEFEIISRNSTYAVAIRV